jgi:hypothetical protein
MEGFTALSFMSDDRTLLTSPVEIFINLVWEVDAAIALMSASYDPPH